VTLPGELFGLYGLGRSHLVATSDFGLLDEQAAQALDRLVRRAHTAGFELRVASGFRDYARQLHIINAKLRGERPVLDDTGAALDRTLTTEEAWLHSVLRYSALPGTSRHHWGTDVDVWDAAAVEEGYPLQLTPAEYGPDGVFAPLTEWLSDLVARDDAEGFFRPYQYDEGGVAPEPWHLSYRPVASGMAGRLEIDWLLRLWRNDVAQVGLDLGAGLACLEYIQPRVEALLNRYVVG